MRLHNVSIEIVGYFHRDGKAVKELFKATVAMISISKTEQMLLPLCTVAQHPRVMVQGKSKNPIFHQ